MKIRVFPDYCSTGLWHEDGYNMDPPSDVPPELVTRLEQWHTVWSQILVKQHCTNQYRQQWLDAGGALVLALNESTADEYVLTVNFDYTARDEF